MEVTTVLVLLLALISWTYLIHCAFQTAKFGGGVAYTDFVIGLVGGGIAVAGIQSGLKPDYAASLAIVGILHQLWAASEMRDVLRETKLEFMMRGSSGAVPTSSSAG